MTKTEPELWTKDFVVVCGANFFVALTFLLLMTNMAVYATAEFDATPSKAGLASSIFIIGALVFRIFAGKYIEETGRKRMLFGGLLLFLAATLLYFVAESLNLLLLVRFIHGAAFGISATAMAVIVMDIIPRERLGEGTSYFSMSGTLAMAIGPFLGVFISQHASFTVIFAVCTLFSVTSIIISLFLRIPGVMANKAQPETGGGFKIGNYFEAGAVPISIIIAIIGFSYSSILSLITSYTKEIDLIDVTSYFFIVYAVFILVSRPFTGWLFDRKGPNLVIYPSLVLFALGLVLVSRVHHGYTLLVAGAVIGLGYGTIVSCSQAIAVKESPRHRVGLATSTFFICLDGGIGAGPYLLGFVIPLLGFRGLYLALAVVVLSCIFLYHILHGRKESYRKQCSVAG